MIHRKLNVADRDDIFVKIKYSPGIGQDVLSLKISINHGMLINVFVNFLTFVHCSFSYLNGRCVVIIRMQVP